MNAKLLKCLNVALVAGLVSLLAPASAQQAEPPTENPPPVPTDELPAGSQILARGPVHEAFAKPVSMDAQSPIIAPNEPPANLQELPPVEKPAGADIVWVPGYWAWDTDRNDFIWVSGCWRNAPPNTYWVPGHWLQLDNGWEWIGGFWKPIETGSQQAIEYLPAPPASFDVEPPGSPSQPDQIWVPGCWYWAGGQFVQRHGYWIAEQVGWTWVPSHYAWTPRGYIFCSGHWDYDLDNRGVLFTPAYFPPNVVRSGFVFSPSVCVDLGMLRLNLFTYPRYRHYYFGDYYDDSFRHAGIYPWFQCQTIHTWYDPLFVYDRWHFQKTDPHWAAAQARQFALLRSNRDLRPARTFSELQTQMNRLPANRRPERPLLESVKTYASSQSTPVKFERITAAERQQIAVKSTEVHQLRNQRSQWEAAATVGPAGARHAAVVANNSGPETLNAQTPRVTTKPAKETKAPKLAPAPTVRATQPERVVLPNPPSVPKPSESRYIEKQPPSHPQQERIRSEESSTRASAGGDAQHGKKGQQP